MIISRNNTSYIKVAHARRQFEGVLRVNFRIHKIGVILPRDIFRLSQ